MLWVSVSAVHQEGYKYGMYSSAGEYTCGQYAGSLGLEEIDANTFAGWGVDYLKCEFSSLLRECMLGRIISKLTDAFSTQDDNCYNKGQSGTANISYERYDRMSQALNNTGREMWYSMCNWGQDRPFDWAYMISNSYRISGDVFDSFDRVDPRCPCSEKEGMDCPFQGYHCSVMNIINKVPWFIARNQLGSWQDLDMLEIGNGGMSDEEYKVMFTMWAVLKSPLIIGTDISTLDPDAYSIYMNPAIIAINQDPGATTATRIWRYFVSPTDVYGTGEIQMWTGGLSYGDYFVVLLNAANQPMLMNATLADIFNDDGGAKSTEAKSSWDLHDLWANRMPSAVAQGILNKNSTMGVGNATSYIYNATAQSYVEGIAANDTLLMGTRTGSVGPLGTVQALVPRHGVVAYRLRPAESVGKRKRDEL